MKVGVANRAGFEAIVHKLRNLNKTSKDNSDLEMFAIDIKNAVNLINRSTEIEPVS